MERGPQPARHRGKGALAYIAMVPGNAAMAPNPKDPNNCAAGETAYTKALQENPESAQMPWRWRGAALPAGPRSRKKLRRLFMSMRAPRPWTRLRAVSRTPRLGRTSTSTCARLYEFPRQRRRLDQLKQLAVQSPLPPADFKLKTASEIAAEKEAEFAKSTIRSWHCGWGCERN